jgi:hypothetical protein
MKLPFLPIEVRLPWVMESPISWAARWYADNYEMENEINGSTYMAMMYAAYTRECKVPAAEVVLVECTNKDGSKGYWFEDRRELMGGE